MIDQGRVMERAQAFKTLRLDQSADGQMVESAYWTLVRQAQHRAARDPEAHVDIDALNDAYQTLTPDSRGKPMSAKSRQEAAGTGVAAALYERLEGIARERHVPRLHAEASEAARRFFLKQGFAVIRRRDFAIAGVPIHNYAVEKWL